MDPIKVQNFVNFVFGEATETVLMQLKAAENVSCEVSFKVLPISARFPRWDNCFLMYSMWTSIRLCSFKLEMIQFVINRNQPKKKIYFSLLCLKRKMSVSKNWESNTFCLSSADAHSCSGSKTPSRNSDQQQPLRSWFYPRDSWISDKTVATACHICRRET